MNAQRKTQFIVRSHDFNGIMVETWPPYSADYTIHWIHLNFNKFLLL